MNFPYISFYHPFGEYPEWCKNYTAPYHLIADKNALQASFENTIPIIGFCASGILIRQIAPLLKDKWHEPPILMVVGEPQKGTIIPLLGGHHGGNQLAKKLAELWQLTPIISTASDQTAFSIDDVPEGWMVNPDSTQYLKQYAKKLIQNQPLTIYADNEHYLNAYQQIIGLNDEYQHLLTPVAKPEKADIIISPFIHENSQAVHIIPPVIVAGLGAIRDADSAITHELFLTACQKANILPQSITAIASIDLKHNETALHHLANHYRKDLRFFSADELKPIKTPNPSKIVENEIGCASVCEASALLLAGEQAQLCQEKIKNTHATCAIAIAEKPLNILKGKKAGFLHVVGLGPGDDAYRLPIANHVLAQSEIIVGYQLYLDMVKQQFPHATYIALPLGQEIERAQTALDYALKGHRTALLASGDPGIYALATLVIEQANKISSPPMIEIIPGITAMQMLSARMGAPMGHDFCAISLSDLLTPKEQIIKRIKAVAEADFVISFYNPQSEKRRDLLPFAIDILQKSRPEHTPVIVGRNLGRVDETITRSNLKDFDCDTIDMFCLVMIGASQSDYVHQKYVYTPRGYHKKENS